MPTEPETSARPQSEPARLYFLDWARLAAFGLLVLYHVGMYYVPWDWHVKSPKASSTLEPWMLLSAPWRMSLLFLVSGAAAAVQLTRLGPGAPGFVGLRSRRLLLPLLFGMAVVVVPQPYFEAIAKYSYSGSFADFLHLYFTADRRFCPNAPGTHCIDLPTWNHLWFLPYLWLYSTLLWLAQRGRPHLLQGLAARAAGSLTGWRLLALPVLWLALLRLALFDPQHNGRNDLISGGYDHALYASMFLSGAVLAHQPRLFDGMARWRWAALGLALAGWLGVQLAIGWMAHGTAPEDGPRVLHRAAWALQQGCAVMAVLGWFRHRLNHDHRWRALLTEAVFPVYILHQTVIVVAAVALRPLALAPAVEGPLLVALALLCCGGVWAVARRLPVLRPWLGMARRGAPV